MKKHERYICTENIKYDKIDKKEIKPFTLIQKAILQKSHSIVITDWTNDCRQEKDNNIFQVSLTFYFANLGP